MSSIRLTTSLPLVSFPRLVGCFHLYAQAFKSILSTNSHAFKCILHTPQHHHYSYPSLPLVSFLRLVGCSSSIRLRIQDYPICSLSRLKVVNTPHGATQHHRKDDREALYKEYGEQRHGHGHQDVLVLLDYRNHLTDATVIVNTVSEGGCGDRDTTSGLTDQGLNTILAASLRNLREGKGGC